MIYKCIYIRICIVNYAKEPNVIKNSIIYWPKNTLLCCYIFNVCVCWNLLVTDIFRSVYSMKEFVFFLQEQQCITNTYVSSVGQRNFYCICRNTLTA